MTSVLLFPCDELGPYAYDPNIQVLWTVELEDPCFPTEAEVLAAVTLNDDYNLTDIVGWEVLTEIITAPPWGAFATQRIGSQSIERAELIFAASRTGTDIRTLLQRFDSGYILLLPSGPFSEFPAAPFNVYPVRVAQITQQQRLRQGGSQLTVQFAIRTAVCESVVAVPET